MSQPQPQPRAPVMNPFTTRSEFAIKAMHAGFLVECYGTHYGRERLDIQGKGVRNCETLAFLEQQPGVEIIDEYTMSHDQIRRYRLCF